MPAKNALAGIVAIERFGHFHFVRFVRERMVLFRSVQFERCVMNSTVLIVVVADGAIEHVVAENHIECLGPRVLSDTEEWRR